MASARRLVGYAVHGGDLEEQSIWRVHHRSEEAVLAFVRREEHGAVRRLERSDSPQTAFLGVLPGALLEHTGYLSAVLLMQLLPFGMKPGGQGEGESECQRARGQSRGQ